MITRKAGRRWPPAAMVLKPASQTPFSALALAETGESRRDPRRVFNVVTGSAGAVGGELTSNPLVRKTLLYRLYRDWPPADGAVREDIKSLHRLGGNAPFIVFDDADLDKAVEGRWRRSSATPDRPASAPTARTSGTGCMTVSPRSCSRRWKNCIGDGLQDGVTTGR